MTSAPKPASRVCGVHAEQAAGRVLAEAVAHAVVAGEVRGALGGRDQVVGGEAVRRVRQVHRLDRRAERAGHVERLVEGREHAGLDALAGELLRDAEADALQVGRGRQPDRLGQADARAVARVGADHRADSSSAVSVTSRVNGPAWSSEEAKAIIP